MAQPLLWLLVFGAAVSRVRGLGSEGVPYKAFLVPGVLAQSVLFVAIFSGLAIIWERDLGITQRLLVAPVFRSAIIVGKAVSAAMRAVVQVCVVLAIVYLTGIPLQWSVPRILGAVATVGLCTILLSAVSSWGSAPTFWTSMSWCCSAGRWWRLPSPAAPSPAGSPENVSPGRRMCLWSAREGRCGHQARTEVRLFTPAS